MGEERRRKRRRRRRIREEEEEKRIRKKEGKKKSKGMECLELLYEILGWNCLEHLWNSCLG